MSFFSDSSGASIFFYTYGLMPCRNAQTALNVSARIANDREASLFSEQEILLKNV